MNAVVILCFLAPVLLATAYPTGLYDADVASMDGAVYPVEGEAAFSGIAPAPEPDSELVSIYGNCDGSYVPIPEPSLLFFEDLPAQENDELDILTDTARFGSVLADSILAEREAEIEAKLAEIDAFVESEFGQTNSQVASTLLHINSAIDSDLERMILQDELGFENIDDLESEPKALAAQLEAKIIADMANTDSLVMKELTKVDSLVESELKKTTALMESEIEKVNSFIESDIAQNEALMESEVSKINAFVDSELAKTEALMQSELEKMDLFVESELAKTECMMTSELSKLNAIMNSKLGNFESATHSKLTMLEVPVEGEVEFSGVAAASGRTKIYGNTGYIPVLTNLNSDYEETYEEMIDPAMGEVEFYDTVPVSGSVIIEGHTGYLAPNLTPLKATPAVERVDNSMAVPVNDEVAIIPDTENMFNDDNFDTIPVVGEVVFSGKAPAVGRVKITGNCASPPIIDSVDAISEKQLINDDVLSGSGVTGYEKVPETVPVVAEAVFSGKAPAQGHVQIVGSSCPPVFPLNPPIVGNSDPSIQNNNVQEFDGDLYLKLANTGSGTQNCPCADVAFPINVLPIVNIMRKEIKVNENGDVEFSATIRVSGNNKMTAQFDCAPLLPTEESPDGRKFIWLSKKSSNDETLSPEPQTSNNPPKIDIPITTYSTEFPETIIMDSNKNYERFLDNHEELIPVAGEVFFEGVAPAYGSVNIRGQSSC